MKHQVIRRIHFPRNCVRSSQLPNHFPKPEATGGKEWWYVAVRRGWMLLRTGLPSKWKPQPVIWKGKVYHGKLQEQLMVSSVPLTFVFSLFGLHMEPLFQFCELKSTQPFVMDTVVHGKAFTEFSPSWSDSELLYPIPRWRNWDSKEKSLINAINTWVINRGVECLCSRLVEVLWFHESFSQPHWNRHCGYLLYLLSRGEPEPATLQ